MKYSDLTEGMREALTSAISNRLLKLGINTEVSIFAKKIYDGREMIHVETAPFNSTPVIYKRIFVMGDGFIEPTDREGIYEIAFLLGYRFEYFRGGENGVDIGSITFRIFEKTGDLTCLGLNI